MNNTWLFINSYLIAAIRLISCDEQKKIVFSLTNAELSGS